MKKILIIAYHSLPMDVIASYRTMAYLRHLKKYGYAPTLITHFWNEETHIQPETEKLDYGKIIRVPLRKSVLGRIFTLLEKKPVINKISILLRWALGFLDTSAKDVDSYYSFRNYCNSHLNNNTYDLLLTIYSPHHNLKLCYELHKEFNLPYVLDFRDLWSGIVLMDNYDSSLAERIHDTLTRIYWKKWLNNATFFSMTSTLLMNKIATLTSTKGVVIHNGFDPELFDGVSQHTDGSIFTIVHGGSLYENQYLEIFLLGCKKFINQTHLNDVRIKFIGGDRKDAIPNKKMGLLFNAKQKINKILATEYCEVSSRIPKKALAQEISNCQLLLLPTLNEPGAHSGKIFDYIASGKNILVVPDDHSVVGELIRETKTGVIANTPEKVCEMLTTYYQEWKETGELAYHGDQTAINKYSRESQVKRMAEAIDQTL